MAAYKQGNNRKIDGHKVIVDFEKGILIFYYRKNTFKLETKKVWRRIRKYQNDKIITLIILSKIKNEKSFTAINSSKRIRKKLLKRKVKR